MKTINNGAATELLDVDLINPTNSHSDSIGAAAGLDYDLNQKIKGDFDHLQFNIGLTPSQNSQPPSEYAAGHPLANSGEFWLGWQSFVFAKMMHPRTRGDLFLFLLAQMKEK